MLRRTRSVDDKRNGVVGFGLHGEQYIWGTEAGLIQQRAKVSTFKYIAKSKIWYVRMGPWIKFRCISQNEDDGK